LPELRPLGRRVNHDPRNLAYPFKARRDVTYASVQHASHIGILDQGDVGACTAYATAGALGCDPFWGATATPTTDAAILDFYAQETREDPFPGAYPAEDTGSDGTTAGKVAKERGYISGYQHALTVGDALGALQQQPIIIGVDWWSSFDHPDATGLVKIASGATVRGGHEICVDGYDADKGLVWLRNSWGTGWAVGGRFNMSVATLVQLLAKDGDATVFAPLTAPAPVPTPTPTDPALSVWWARSRSWAHTRHVGGNAAAARAALALAAAKGLT
jgi:hypothetical protein